MRSSRGVELLVTLGKVFVEVKDLLLLGGGHDRRTSSGVHVS
jgi:hypothetical protein